MADPERIRTGTDRLRVGRTLKHPIYDSQGPLLLAPGAEITAELKAKLLSRGIHEVAAHPDDIRELGDDDVQIELTSTAEVARRVEALAEHVSLAVKNAEAPLLEEVREHGCEPYDPASDQRLQEQFQAASKLVNTLVSGVLEGNGAEVDPLTQLAGQYTEELTEDGDHVVSASERLGNTFDITERSVRMATLAMSVGLRMGFDRQHVTNLGICSLVQDWGLLCLPERMRNPKEPYSAEDWEHFMQHPAYTVDALGHVRGVPDAIVVAAFQVHEQVNGSGYPLGLTGDKIHPYAKIINVVDQYMFLTSTFRGRPAVYPYDAMAYLLTNVGTGRFDADAVRGALTALALFPIGSHVELTDGTEASVVRQNAAQQASPIVQRVGHDQLIDLAASRLEVKRPLPTPGRSEMRLERESLTDLIWQGPE